MASLLDMFGTGGTQTLGLLGGDIESARNDAQAQALYALAGSLLSGGPTGLSIARGLQQGQQAYKQAMRGSLEEQLQSTQVQEMLRRRKLEEEALRRQQMVDATVARGLRPAQPEITTETPLLDIYGQQQMGPNMPQAAQPARFDLQSIIPDLRATPEGRKTLLELMQTEKAMLGDLTKLGKNEQLIRFNPLTQTAEVVAGAQKREPMQGNPFDVFANDPAVPPALRATAQRYQKSYASGNIDEETADKRFSELASRIQSSEQFQQNQQALAAQRQQTNILAQGQQALAQNLANVREEEIKQRIEARREEQQKPVSEAKEAINLINQAESLLDTATGSLTGTGIDILAGAFGKSTPGAQSAAKLKAIQGALVAKMPKMSGPQSDKDVLLYREMAAQVGDSTLPTETRKAALETLREIQERYAKVPTGESKPPAQTSPFKFDPAKEERYQQWLKSQGRK